MAEEQGSTFPHTPLTADFLIAQVYLAFKLVHDPAVPSCSRYCFHQSLSLLLCDLTADYSNSFECYFNEQR